MVREKLCVLCVNHIHTVYDHNNNNLCQASTFSSTYITKIKLVVFFNSKTWNVELVVQKDQNIEKITFKFVQMKSLAMHILYTERKK